MFKKIKAGKTKLRGSATTKGETLEQKIRRIMQNKEGIEDGAPIIYTERKDGVQPAYNIRADRFEIAIDAMDSITKGHKARREERIGKKAIEGMNKESKTETKNEGGA